MTETQSSLLGVFIDLHAEITVSQVLHLREPVKFFLWTGDAQLIVERSII